MTENDVTLDPALSDGPPAEPDAQAVSLFWRQASKVSGMTRLDVVVGENPLAAIEPPAMCFGDTARLATELVALVTAGTKTATASVLRDYDPHVVELVQRAFQSEDESPLRELEAIDPSDLEGEPLPEPGLLWIGCDGAGAPRALIETTAVDIVPFDEVDTEHAAAEGEGDLSLDFWRRAHVRFLPGHEGRDLDEPWPAGVPWPKDLMVLERITCVFPTEPTGFAGMF